MKETIMRNFFKNFLYLFVIIFLLSPYANAGQAKLLYKGEYGDLGDGSSATNVKACQKIYQTFKLYNSSSTNAYSYRLALRNDHSVKFSSFSINSWSNGTAQVDGYEVPNQSGSQRIYLDILDGSGNALPVIGTGLYMDLNIDNSNYKRWYSDVDDNDGYGDPNDYKYACTKPYRYVDNNSDNCPTVYGKDEKKWYSDEDDNDGYCDPNDYKYACTKPYRYVDNNSDNCPTVYGKDKKKWYSDVDDNDGYGDPNDYQYACTQPYRHVDNSNDNCPTIYGKDKKKWYSDEDDNDGYGDPNDYKYACTQPYRYVDNTNDNCPTVYGKDKKKWYRDSDNDGYGDPSDYRYECTKPSGYVDNSNDNCPSVYGKDKKKWYRDSDNDGFGDPNDFRDECTKPSGYVDNSSDICPSVYGKDKKKWFRDSDNDGYGDPNDFRDECSQPSGFVDNSNDLCPTVYGKDKKKWYQDKDNDTFGDPNSFLIECSKPTGYVEDSSDQCPDDSNKKEKGICGCNVDDSNYKTYYYDGDNDLAGDPNTPQQSCTKPQDYVLDSSDKCPNDSNKTEPGHCGCKIDESNFKTYYYDGDNDLAGDPNKSQESCTKPINYVLDKSDQCPDDSNKTEPGNCGCNVADDSILPPSVSDIEVCSGDTAKLIGQASSGNIKWYDSLTALSPIHTGSTYDFKPTDSVSYFVSLNLGGKCESTRKTVSVTVKSCNISIQDFAINNDDLTTTSQTVQLSFTASNSPTHYIVSEKSDFSDSDWIEFSNNLSFTLTSDFNEKRVYFKAKNASGESPVVSDTISLVPENCSITGIIKYSLQVQGLLIVDAFDIDDTSFEKPVNLGQSYDWNSDDTQKAFQLTLSAGSYLIRAYIDTNENGFADSNEPQGTCQTPIMCGTSDCQINLSAPISKKGDINDDGVINMLDVKEAFLFFIGMKKPTEPQRQAADVSPYPCGDGTIGLEDVKVIFQIAIGLLTIPEC